MPRGNDLIGQGMHLAGRHAAVSPEVRIKNKFEALGGEAVLGGVARKEPDIWTLRNGAAIVDNPTEHAAYGIHGAIYQKWIEFGGKAFGLPTTDESPAPDGVGRFNHFNGGTASIYWSPATGAHALWGDTHRHWAQLGWERSYLGYPTSDEVDFPDGGRAVSFQNGGIYWWPDLGAIDLRAVIVAFKGLHCFGETDWDQSSTEDEPYMILSVTAPQFTQTIRTRIFEDVDKGEARPDFVEIYRGSPYGINIGTTLMEYDFGDPDKYRKQVQDAVDATHSAGTAALGLIPFVGPIIATIAGPTLGALMPALGGAVNKLFDWGDDKIGGAVLTFGARQMVELAARVQDQTFGPIAFKVETPLISGSGASYKGYFSLFPA